MSASAAFWTVLAGTVLFFCAGFAKRQPEQPAPSRARANRRAWIIAAGTSTSVLAGIAITVAGLGAAVTIVDVLALAMAGVIAGASLMRGPAFRRRD